MNAERRKAIKSAMDTINAVINIGAMEEFVEAISEVKDGEEEALENLPGGTDTERGEKMETAIGALEDLISAVEEIIEKFGELEELANTAME